MKIILQFFITALFIIFCFSNNLYAQSSSSSPLGDIKQLRVEIINTIKSQDWASLKKLTDSCKNLKYEKYILLWRDEKPILLLLSGFIKDALNEKWEITDVAYNDTDSKGKTKLRAKRVSNTDSLSFWLRSAFASKYSLITNQIETDSSLTLIEKDFLFAKAAAFNVLASNNKKEPLKTLDKNLKLFKQKYPNSQYQPGINYFKYISRGLKMGAFFGGGFSIGKFNNGVQNIFASPVNYHMGFDLYYNRIGWYISYSITSSGLKNKVDTSFNKTLWPKGTNNFISDAQAGIGIVAVKTDYARFIVKAGLGSFSMQPVKKAEYSEALRKVKLKQLPYFNAGACIDFANFKIRYTNKRNKLPLGLRAFYQYNFLSFKNKYPGFPSNFKNYGIQIGMAL